ncbi:phage minor capsid protein, partial [Kitasatospora herbaricolor]|uniref:phage minor capsid protein n=1 Tax=Kitasatospora herbaricolor TaxID=68217 RepID=UPI0036DE6FBF
MAVYLPDPEGPAAADLIEAFGAELAARYGAVEQVMAEAIAKRAYVILALQQAADDESLTLLQHQVRLQELALARARVLRELRRLAETEVRRIRDENLAESIVQLAAKEGEAAAAARLKMARRLPVGTPITAGATSAVTQLTLDLTSRLELLNARILRYPMDAYQQIIAETAPINILGGATRLQVQQRAVQRFLADGIDGFTDRADRRWRIGTYAEMAGRTATQRAYQDAGVWRMQQSGVNLVTIVRGADPCKKCAGWSGKILSTTGE